MTHVQDEINACLAQKIGWFGIGRLPAIKSWLVAEQWLTRGDVSSFGSDEDIGHINEKGAVSQP